MNSLFRGPNRAIVRALTSRQSCARMKRRYVVFGLVGILLFATVASWGQVTVDIGAGTLSQPQQAKPAQGQEVVTNETIISLTQASLGEALIISKIRVSTCSFDVSTNAMLNLKKAGVADTVIQAMIQVSTPDANVTATKTDSTSPNNPHSPHDAGIYSYDGKSMVQLEPTVYSGTKTGGLFKSAMTYGIATAKIKASIRNPHSAIRILSTIDCYFYFEQTSSGLSNTTGIGAYLGGATSPNEFVLQRMESKKDGREVVLSSFGAFRMSTGVQGKDSIDFAATKVAPGVYKVSLSHLRPGEYCFYYGSSMQPQGKLFDFGVDE
jgi:hypothetical protein